MSSRAARAVARTLIVLACGIVIGIGVVLAFVHPRFTYVTLTGDDAGYYFAIARNFLLGHGFSFDRLHETNGFNPLEPLLLIPFFALLRPRLDVVGCFHTGVLVTWVFAAAAMFPLAKLSDRLLAREGATAEDRLLLRNAVLLFYAAAVVLKGFYGMDAFLAVYLGLVYLARVSNRGLLAPGAKAAIVDGGLLGLLFLARVDSLPLVAASLALAAGSAWVGGGGWVRLVGRIATFLALILPYFAWGVMRFGTWMPVSARMKTSFPHLDLPGSLGTVFHSSLNAADIAAVFAGLATAAAIALIAARGLASRTELDRFFADSPRVALLALSLGIGGRLAWLVLFSRFDVQSGYFLLVYPLLALALAVAAARAGRLGSLTGTAALVAVALVLAAGRVRAASTRLEPILHGAADDWDFARRVHDVVRPDEVIYGGAFGMIGFAADRRWINGDGVANDLAYQDAIRAGALRSYLVSNRVDYVAINVPRLRGNDAVSPEPFQLQVRSALYDRADSVAVNGSDLVLKGWSIRGNGSLLALFRWPPASDTTDGSRRRTR